MPVDDVIVFLSDDSLMEAGMRAGTSNCWLTLRKYPHTEQIILPVDRIDDVIILLQKVKQESLNMRMPNSDAGELY